MRMTLVLGKSPGVLTDIINFSIYNEHGIHVVKLVVQETNVKSM